MITLIPLYDGGYKSFYTPIIIVFGIIFLSVLFFVLFPYLKDFNDIKNNKFYKIIGTVKSINLKSSNNKIKQITFTDENQKEIILRMEVLPVGESYEIYYLKNTKLAIVGDKIAI
jgi:hypothetical protein